MRFFLLVLLGILLILTFNLAGGGEHASGQSTQVDDSKTQLVNAFVLVQKADVAGASPDQISQLTNDLNLALQYQENSGQPFDLYANKSANLSSAVAAQALSLASTTREQAFLRQALAYSTAVGAGFGCALIVTEFHRIREFARRFRLRSTPLD